MDWDIERAPYEQPIAGRLHPSVYYIMAVFGLCFIAGAWGFFGGQGKQGFVLAVVTIFISAVTGLSYVLWRVRVSKTGEKTIAKPASFTAWLGTDLDMGGSKVKASTATLEALLPIAAVAVGMVVFALLLHFAIGIYA